MCRISSILAMRWYKSPILLEYRHSYYCKKTKLMVPDLQVLRRWRLQKSHKSGWLLGFPLLLKPPSFRWMCHRSDQPRRFVRRRLQFPWWSDWVHIKGCTSTCGSISTKCPLEIIGASPKSLVATLRGPRWLRASTFSIQTCSFIC